MPSYLISLTFCWGALFMLYALFLRKETFFNLNRFYLLGSLVLGLIIPAIEIPTQVQVTEAPLNDSAFYLQTVVVGSLNEIENQVQEAQLNSGLELSSVLTLIYILGVLFFSLRFIIGLRQLGKLTSVSETRKKGAIKLVLTKGLHSPFAFLNSLFIPDSFDLSNKDNQKIIKHESAHIQQRHTLDILFMEVLNILFWCVFPIYLFKKSLKETHEYLADAEVLKETKKKQYGLLLLRQVHQGRMRLSLVNHFNQSQLKKRIMMMTKKPSERRAIWKYLAALPLCLLLIFAFANHKGHAKLSGLSILSDSFNPVKIKEKFTEFALVYNLANTEEEKQNAFKNLANSFEAELQNNPDFQAEIKNILTDVTNQEGIAVAIVNSEKKDKFATVVHIGDLTDPVYKEVDEMPRFPGCEDKTGDVQKECAQRELLMFIYKNIKYPAEARDKDIEGTVVSSFIIGKEGKVRDAKIVRSIGGGCDEAVLEIVAQMPNWIPGMKDGEKVAVEFKLPVKFKLEGKASEKKAQIPEAINFDSKLELKNFLVSPNPSNGNFRLEFSGEGKNLEVAVFDLKGTILESIDLTGFEGTFARDISVNTSAGTIIVAVVDKAKEQVYWEKVIINK